MIGLAIAPLVIIITLASSLSYWASQLNCPAIEHYSSGPCAQPIIIGTSIASTMVSLPRRNIIIMSQLGKTNVFVINGSGNHEYEVKVTNYSKE